MVLPPVSDPLRPSQSKAARASSLHSHTPNAVTSIKSGVADNVLPGTGRLTFNLRAHPGGEDSLLCSRGPACVCPAMLESGRLQLLYEVPIPYPLLPDTPRQELLDYLQRAMAAVHTFPGGKLEISSASHEGPIPGVFTSCSCPAEVCLYYSLPRPALPCCSLLLCRVKSSHHLVLR